MQIVIATGPFIPAPPARSGAVEKSWFILGREFVRRGHRVTMVGRASEDCPADTFVEGVRLVRAGGYERRGSTWKDLGFDLLFSRSLRKLVPQADVLVTNGFFQPLTLKPVQKRGAVMVIHMARFPKHQTGLYRHADRIHVPSQPILEAVARQCPSANSQLKVIDYPVDTDVFKASGSDPEPRTVLYAGRVHPEKGVHLLAEAVARVKGPPVILRIAGPVEIGRGGAGDEYADRIRRLATSHPVEFMGNLGDPAALAREMQRATVFCYPSLAEKGETFGISPLEAMAAGTPSVVSGLDVFQAHIQHQVTGLVFDHRTATAVQDLAAALQQLLENQALRQRFSLAGQQHARLFSVAKIADAHLQDFEELITRRRS